MLACVALSAAYLAFYIHRTDICFQVTLQKRLLATWFVVVLASEVLHHLPGRRSRFARVPATVRRPAVFDRLPDAEVESVPA